MFKNIDMEGIHGIKGTPQNSGFLACGTMQWKICNNDNAITPQALSIKPLGFPGGAICQIRVNMMEERVNEHKNDKVGRGSVVPCTT